MSKFGGMKSQRAAARAVTAEAPPAIETAEAAPARAGAGAGAGAGGRNAARVGKKAVSAYFSPELSKALHTLAIEQERTLQSLMGEAIDLLLRQYGKHPFNEG